MPTEPYVPSVPGGLITAENMNLMQIKIREDIPKQIKSAIDAIPRVPRSDDAAKLDGKSLEQIAKQIIEQAVAELNKKTGYLRYFRRLKGEEEVVKHNLHDAPVTDLYQLEYFDVISSEDGIKRKQVALFFLYHSSEKRINAKNDVTNALETAEIEPSAGEATRIPWAQLLELYRVEYDDDTTLDTLEDNFWDKLFADPSESFDDDQTAHSPWFDRCCGEKRTVRDLKNSGAWKELWLKMQPVKTINVFSPAGIVPSVHRPLSVRVRHLDLDRTGFLANGSPINQDPNPNVPDRLRTELPVMILQKV